MKKEKIQRLKGSVLLTVVSVMAILVLFMVGTLTLATAANNRAHANYSDSQAEYTARAAIQSFTQAMAQNNAVAQTIVNMSKSEVLQPTVVISDTAMGRVGYYDANNNWVDNKIRIEYADDTYAYDQTDGWGELALLKITATAKVGKEEKTVTSYIRKKLPNEAEPLAIKGFQTLGNANFTTTEGYVSGALCIGITDNNRAPYTLSNASKFDTDITFINGGLKIAGQNIVISASKLSAGTVVLGDMDVQNDFVIEVDYPYATRKSASDPWTYSELTQKNIPYLYVDGKLNPSTGMNIRATGIDTATVLSNGAPYNVFCGSYDGRSNNNVNIDADMYIMDETGTSYLGGSAGSTNLYRWSSSVLNKTSTQFSSAGGNIYSNHDVELSKITIKGSLVVNGNCHVGPDVRIEGDLVVNGNVTGNTDLAGVVKGNIYVKTPSQVSGTGLKVDVYSRSNTYYDSNIKPGYVKVRNIERGSIAVENLGLDTVAYETFTYPNYVGDSTVAEIIEHRNDRVTEYNEIILSRDYANYGSVYYTGEEDYADITVNKDDGTIVPFSEFKKIDSYRLYMIEIDGQYYDYIPYVNAVDGSYTAFARSYELLLPDGSRSSFSTNDDITIYKADKNGNRTDINANGALSVTYDVDYKGQPMDTETDVAVRRYKVNKEGEPIDELTDQPIIYYVVAPDKTTVTDEVSDSAYTYYKPDGNGAITSERAESHHYYFKADKDGNATDVTTDDEFTYYRLSDSAEVDKDDASGSKFYTLWYDPSQTVLDTYVDDGHGNLVLVGETNAVYYYDEDPTGHENDADWLKSKSAGGHRITQTEAFGSATINAITAYGSYDVARDSVYPIKMSREYINGTADSGNSKIIQTLKDIQDSVGYNGSGFDANVFYKEVPGAVINSGIYQGFEYISVSTGNTYNITTNTVLKAGSFNGGSGTTININPNGGEIWVVLDDIDFDTAPHKIICGGSGTVNFFIKGDVSMDGNGAGIFTKKIYDQIVKGGNVVVREDDVININYYGAENSSLTAGNQVLFCGIAKCPYTDYGIGSQGHQSTFAYVDANGKLSTFTGVNWIGNALFDEFKTSANNFKMLYTDSSGSKSHHTIANADLGEAWQIMYYDVS